MGNIYLLNSLTLNSATNVPIIATVPPAIAKITAHDGIGAPKPRARAAIIPAVSRTTMVRKRTGSRRVIVAALTNRCRIGNIQFVDPRLEIKAKLIMGLLEKRQFPLESLFGEVHALL